MTSSYVIMVCATSAGASVMRSMSRPQQLLFAYASDGASPLRKDHVTDEHN